ncbi:MAG: sigma-54 interaction domain-containing protein [Phycisphaerae bacterium]
MHDNNGNHSNGHRYREPELPALVGTAPCMKRLRRQITAVARHGCTVLICGESGTGKEIVARHIHAASRRAAGPLVIADCTALPDTLIASQLFGHVKGAFTDARQSTLGLFRAADGGTLFIDEVAELQLHTQATLLRCIQERSVLPVGAFDPIPVNVRIIAATNRDLKAMVMRGEFRADLYYRLDVVRLVTPPLRDHTRDVAALAIHFLEQQAELAGTTPKAFSAQAIEALSSYPWPGNVRELSNVIERATVLSDDETLTILDLPHRFRGATRRAQPDDAYLGEEIAPLRIMERRLIQRALGATGGNQCAAARLLDVERHRFARMIRRHDLQDLVRALRASSPVPTSADPIAPLPPSEISFDQRTHAHLQPTVAVDDNG